WRMPGAWPSSSTPAMRSTASTTSASSTAPAPARAGSARPGRSPSISPGARKAACRACTSRWRFPSKGRAMQRRSLLLLTPLLLLLPAAALAWLLLTESGLHGAAALATRLSGGLLQLEQVSGRLAGPLHIGAVRWQDADTRVQVRDLELRWSPLSLLRGTLQIEALGLGATDIETGSSEEAARLPDSLALPLDVNIEMLTVAPLRINGHLIADSVSAAMRAGSGHHVLEGLQLRRGELSVQAQGRLAARPPFALDLDAELAGKLEDQAFALALKAGGDLQRSTLELQRRAG